MTNKEIAFRVLSPVLFDTEIWHDAKDGDGKVWASFKIRPFDALSTRIRTELLNINHDHPYIEADQNDLDALGKNMDRLRNIVAKIIVADWKGVTDADGEEIPFSPEMAELFFSIDEHMWIVRDIQDAAIVAENFKTGNIEKNSRRASNGTSKKA